MIELNKIYNEDCFTTMLKMKDNQVDIILTSPPYNTSKTSGNINDHQNRYDIHLDNKTNEEYIKWTLDLFNQFDMILNPNGIVLYNMSYASGKINKGKHDLLWIVISEIIKNTNFTVADCIVWKKSSAIPDNMTPNKCTRICENVFVFCRKEEYDTFKSNKEVVGVMPHNNCKIYNTMTNFIEAKNNDGSNKLNKATFSSDLVLQLLQRYANENSVVYDPFMGTGTTAVGCLKYGCDYIGSELSEKQVEYANNRIIDKNNT